MSQQSADGSGGRRRSRGPRGIFSPAKHRGGILQVRANCPLCGTANSDLQPGICQMVLCRSSFWMPAGQCVVRVTCHVTECLPRLASLPISWQHVF